MVSSSPSPLSTVASVARGELDPGLEGLAVYMHSSRRGRLSVFSDAEMSKAEEDKC